MAVVASDCYTHEKMTRFGSRFFENGRRSGSCFDVHSSMLECSYRIQARAKNLRAFRSKRDTSRRKARRATNDDRRWEFGVLLCFLTQVVVFLLFKQAPSPGETQCSGKRAEAIGRVQPRSIRTDWLLRAQRAQRSGQ